MSKIDYSIVDGMLCRNKSKCKQKHLTILNYNLGVALKWPYLNHKY